MIRHLCCVTDEGVSVGRYDGGLRERSRGEPRTWAAGQCDMDQDSWYRDTAYRSRPHKRWREPAYSARKYSKKPFRSKTPRCRPNRRVEGP